MKTTRAQVEPFTTKDGSIIRELMHPQGVPAARLQSLAEATVPPGGKTTLHLHHKAEEVYHFLAGAGVMRLGEERFDVRPGDTVVIPPGTPHEVQNAAADDLVLLCACSPPYSDEDTLLLDAPSDR